MQNTVYKDLLYTIIYSMLEGLWWMEVSPAVLAPKSNGFPPLLILPIHAYFEHSRAKTPNYVQYFYDPPQTLYVPSSVNFSRAFPLN